MPPGIYSRKYSIINIKEYKLMGLKMSYTATNQRAGQPGSDICGQFFWSVVNSVTSHNQCNSLKLATARGGGFSL